MNKYIVILRGINVSGQKKIKMADLKTLLEQLGYHNVITYIQSGNVIFSSDIDDTSIIENSIEQAIVEQYGFNVPVQVLRHKELEGILRQLPFKDVCIEKDGAQVMFTFLSGAINTAGIADIEKFSADSERLCIKHNVVYIHCPNGYGNTKLSNNLIEKKLNVSATTRNLKTIVKLCELASV